MKKLVIVSAALALAACGSESSGTFETEDGQGTYTVDRDMDGSADINIKTDDGELNIQTGGQLAGDMPDGFSLYPGASVISSSRFSQGEGEGMLVMMQTADSPDSLTDFYRKQAEAAGHEIRMEVTTAQGKMISGKNEAGDVFSLNVSTDDEGLATGQLSLGSGLAN